MKDYTEIICILDRSGSMNSIKDDAIGGFNSFLAGQKADDGRAKMSIVLFDDQYEILCDSVDLKGVNPLNNSTFVPRGMTALFDAVGRSINVTGARLGALPENDRPEKVIVVILTDGHENCSKEFTGEQVAKMIAHQKEKYNWEFIFLAANQDAIKTAESMNISGGNALNFEATGRGMKKGYDSLTKAVSKSRKSKGRQDDLFSDEGKA